MVRHLKYSMVGPVLQLYLLYLFDRNVPVPGEWPRPLDTRLGKPPCRGSRRRGGLRSDSNWSSGTSVARNAAI